jgi:sterol desaturase/sphingolipid hydroxylase (fatty acid hydroxylase superfamily)
VSDRTAGGWPGTLWGAVFASCLGATYVGLALGEDHENVLIGVTTLAGILLIIAERARPHRVEWRSPDGQWWNDLGHFVASFVVGSFGGAWLASRLFASPLWSVWPSSWPMVLQVFAGLVIAEFFGYWQHRALHTFPVLWPLHALHHSTSRMTFFKATRIHALDIGSFTLMSAGSLLALGASSEVVLWVTAFGNFAAVTQHSNVSLPTPEWINKCVGTPAVHWLHHSRDLRDGNSNFGMNVMIFDHVFGSYVAPGEQRGAQLGIEPDFVPTDFLGQIALPLETARRLLSGVAWSRPAEPRRSKMRPDSHERRIVRGDQHDVSARPMR